MTDLLLEKVQDSLKTIILYYNILQMSADEPIIIFTLWIEKIGYC